MVSLLTLVNLLCSLPTDKVGSTLGNGRKLLDQPPLVPYEPQDTENLLVPKPKYNNINLRQLRDNSPQAGPDKKPVAWKYFGNPDQVTSGLGTGIFGPNISEGNRTVPLCDDTWSF